MTHSENLRKIGRVINVYRLYGKTELAAGLQNGRKTLRAASSFCSHCPKAHCARNNLAHEFDTFDTGFFRENRDAGYIATGTRKAIRQSRRDWINGSEGDYWNGLSCLVGRKRSRRA
jgi:hypothetical protein